MDFPTLLGHSSKEAQLANWKNPEHLVTNWLPASPQSATTGHRRLAPTTCRSTLLPLPPLAPTFAFPLFCCSASLACTTCATALLCCTPNLTKPPSFSPQRREQRDGKLRGCHDLRTRHLCTHSSWRWLAPPLRTTPGRARASLRLAAIRFRTRGSSSAPPGLTAVENRNYAV